MAHQLTRVAETGNGSILNRRKMRFKFCIQESLDNRYCFKCLNKESLRALDNFIKQTVDKQLSITEVDDLFLRTKGRGQNYELKVINGAQREVFHYGKDRTPFRIFGYYNEEGYFVIYRIDPNHKTHKSK